MSNFVKKISIICLLAFVATVGVYAKNPKYIFLLIGDGMSFPQRMLAEEFSIKTADKKLVLNHFKNQAVTTTHAANSLITDSAAAGTAIACGAKTNNGMISVLPDGKTKLESIAKVAKQNGKKVGIISNVTINHATPAVFYANRESRGMYYELGLDLIASDFDYFGGGGAGSADNTKSPLYQGNLYDLAKKAGYKVAKTPKEIKAIKQQDQKVWAVAAPSRMPFAIDRKEGDITLEFLTKQAIDFLDNENGFFLMVEGGQIDTMCHANDAGTVLHETLDFNTVVETAYKFALKHPDEVLIVVTGDHETGGLTLGFAGTGYKSYIENLQYQTCSMNELSSKLAKVDPTSGFNSVEDILSDTFGFAFSEKSDKAIKLTDKEKKQLESAFKEHYKDWTKEKKKVKNTLTIAAVKIFNNKASLAWTSNAHTALPVNTTTYGVKADEFYGMIDNTKIAELLKEFVKK